VKTLSCLVDRSAGNGLLRRAAIADRAHRRGRAAPTDRIATSRPSRRQQLRLEGADTPSTHLIPVIDHQMNDSRLMKSRGLMHRRRGPIPPVF
jgi:hypothetical protein